MMTVTVEHAQSANHVPRAIRRPRRPDRTHAPPAAKGQLRALYAAQAGPQPQPEAAGNSAVARPSVPPAQEVPVLQSDLTRACLARRYRVAAALPTSG